MEQTGESCLKEFEKHFSFRLNKFLNFSDICFSHHSPLHTDPDKINTFHLVGEAIQQPRAGKIF